jgi:hypothetical protein
MITVGAKKFAPLAGTRLVPPVDGAAGVSIDAAYRLFGVANAASVSSGAVVTCPGGCAGAGRIGSPEVPLPAVANTPTATAAVMIVFCLVLFTFATAPILSLENSAAIY